MSSNVKPSIKLSLPLEFQQDIFNELRSEDELLILARGLGLLRIVTNLLHSYDAAGNNHIIVVGADERENGWIGEALASQAAVSESPKARGLKLVNSEAMTISTREKLYSQGGIISITSQILIVDLLVKLLDPVSITGLVVLHADKVQATSTEAFILRVYRQLNRSGFLKAFSDRPEPFCTGFAPLSTMMRNLFLTRPSLYPRFHLTVTRSVEGPKRVEVIDVAVPMTDGMSTIQNALLDCIQSCVSELRRGNKSLELDDFTPEQVLQRDFDSLVRRQLDPNWHRLSPKTKRIASDLTILRNILQNLPILDAVEFNKYLDMVHATAKPPSNWKGADTNWLLLPAAETLFDTARRRVFTGKLNADVKDVESLNSVLEEPPKWAALAEILDDIDKEVYFNPPLRDDSNGTILIMCSDSQTCSQLREYLRKMHVKVNHSTSAPRADDADEQSDDEQGPSGKLLMRQRLRSYLAWRQNYTAVRDMLSSEDAKPQTEKRDGRFNSATRGRASPNKRRRVRGGSTTATSSRHESSMHSAGDRDAHLKSLIAELDASGVEAAPVKIEYVDALDDRDDSYELYDMDDLILIHPYDGDMDEHVLEEVKPRYVIMYEPEPSFIRRLEVYRSSHLDRKIRVFFMYYEHSVEQQRFIEGVRKEKDAFTKLIKERANMTVTLTTAGNQTAEETFLRTVNTRIAGGGRIAATQEPPRVVVDSREFKSSLPSLLHGRSMVLVPCVLTVGDYILTPDICIERKSVSDLIGSLNSGRLYEQAERMQRYYKSPMLLIEFSQNKSFTLVPFTDLSSGGSGASSHEAMGGGTPDLCAKLVMLTLAFPRMRIIWSSDPYQTAVIFEELKKMQAEPDAAKAVQLGLEDGAEAGKEVLNHTVMDMLRQVPGITETNISRISLEVESLVQLANMSMEELEPLVGRAVAGQVRRFFDRNVTEIAPSSSLM